jgi:hypothetical protein
MTRGAPGVTRKRFEAPDPVDASDGLVCNHRSSGHRPERHGSVSPLQLGKRRRAALAARLAPIAAMAELVADPRSCPMMSAQAWSSPTAPAKCAESVIAMAAVDDCIAVVIASPATSNASTQSKRDHPLTRRTQPRTQIHAPPGPSPSEGCPRR